MTRIGTATLIYAGQRSSPPMAAQLERLVGEAVRLLGRLGHGDCIKLHHLGTYNPNSRLPNGLSSEHAAYPPRAIDIAGVEWANGSGALYSSDRPRLPDDHLRVEACLRLAGFGIVLGYDYNWAHRDHWHCDYSVPYGMAGSSQRQFAQRVLAYGGYKSIKRAQEQLGLTPDDVLGPNTLEALCRRAITVTAPPDRVVIVHDKRIPYTTVEETAWVPLRPLCDALEIGIDTLGWPEISLILPRPQKRYQNGSNSLA